MANLLFIHKYCTVSGQITYHKDIRVVKSLDNKNFKKL